MRDFDWSAPEVNLLGSYRSARDATLDRRLLLLLLPLLVPPPLVLSLVALMLRRCLCLHFFLSGVS